MNKRVTLKKDYTIKLNSQITKHLTPKFIYLPLFDNDKIYSKKEIKKEEKISDYLISTVSGEILGTKYNLIASGQVVRCLTILNDYKETFWKRNAVRKNISTISLESVLVELKEFRYDSLAQKIQNSKKCKTLVLNCIEDEPYVASEIFVGINNTEIILEMLDALLDICHFPEIKIVVKNTDRESIEAYENYLGTYHDIELVCVPDYYLLGRDKFLNEFLHLKNSVNLLPSEVIKIYNAIKRHRYTSEKVFTISGNGIVNPQVIEAKIGSSIKEIMDEHIKIKKNIETIVYVNGLMTGKVLEIENLIVTEDLHSILIMQKENVVEEACWNCGKCFQICPMGCNPREFIETHRKRDIKDCINCGLCSYMCPAFINLRREIEGDENE